MTKIDYSIIPEHMRAGAKAYIENGVQPGGFLTAVLSNDLVMAWYHGDDINRKAMGGWAKWLWQREIPRKCWGSKRAISDWVHHDGLEGVDIVR